MIALNDRAFVVDWKELERWSVGALRQSIWHWPDAVVQPIGSVLRRKQEPVNKDLDVTEIPIIEKITFGGVVSVTAPEARKGYKGRLFWARRGDFIYSKIRAKQGSFCIVPQGIEELAVSTEYPVFTVDPSLAEADYISLAMRSSFFLHYLDGLSHGSSTKTRIAPDDFEQLRIPLPPLAVQQAIVAHWKKSHEEAARLRERVEANEEAIPRLILERLGIPVRGEITLPRAFALNWNELERWSVSYSARSLMGLNDAQKAQYPVLNLGDISRVSYGIQKSPSNRPGANARPYLRVANVQRGRLDLSEIKYIEVPDSVMDTFRLAKGDLLVCEGNSADLVGRPAIWWDEFPDCVHQNHLLKVRVNPDFALPEYVLEYMSTQPTRTYFRARAKFTTNLASINSNDLREMPIPLPPLEVQAEIVEEVKARRAEISREKARAEALLKQATADVEAMILGTLPPPNA